MLANDLNSTALRLQDLSKLVKARPTSAESEKAIDAEFKGISRALAKPPKNRAEKPLYDKLVKELRMLSGQHKALKTDALAVEDVSVDNTSFITANELHTINSNSFIELGNFDSLVLKERNKELQDLTQAVLQTGQAASNISSMIAKQGDQIDSVDTGVEKTNLDTQVALNELGQASKFLDSYRKKLLVVACIIVTLIACGILLGVLLATQ